MALDPTTSRMFFFIITFWILIGILSQFFGVEAAKTEITNHGSKFELPILIQIMAFQYSDQVPALLAVFLDGFFIFTLFIGAMALRG